MSQSLQQEIINLNKAVSKFATGMSDKLKRKARKGFRGWDDITLENNIREHLKTNFQKFIDGDNNQAHDCANEIMMLYYLRGGK